MKLTLHIVPVNLKRFIDARCVRFFWWKNMSKTDIDTRFPHSLTQSLSHSLSHSLTLRGQRALRRHGVDAWARCGPIQLL